MTTQDAQADLRGDRVRAPTRAVAYAIVPFLVAGFAVLYPVPGDTGRLFAWHIASPLTAMVLGSAYLGGAYFFVRAARATAWHRIKADAGEVLLPPVAAQVIRGVGVAAVATGGLLFVMPAATARWWPWAVTPLTARILGAIFCLGVAGVAAPADRRWSTVRLPVQVALIMLVLMLVAGLRAHAEFTGGATTWMFGAGFAVVTVALAVLYRRMERAAAPR